MNPHPSVMAATAAAMAACALFAWASCPSDRAADGSVNAEPTPVSQRTEPGSPGPAYWLAVKPGCPIPSRSTGIAAPAQEDGPRELPCTINLLGPRDAGIDIIRKRRSESKHVIPAYLPACGINPGQGRSKPWTGEGDPADRGALSTSVLINDAVSKCYFDQARTVEVICTESCPAVSCDGGAELPVLRCNAMTEYLFGEARALDPDNPVDTSKYRQNRNTCVQAPSRKRNLSLQLVAVVLDPPADGWKRCPTQ